MISRDGRKFPAPALHKVRMERKGSPGNLVHRVGC